MPKIGLKAVGIRWIVESLWTEISLFVITLFCFMFIFICQSKNFPLVYAPPLPVRVSLVCFLVRRETFLGRIEVRCPSCHHHQLFWESNPQSLQPMHANNYTPWMLSLDSSVSALINTYFARLPRSVSHRSHLWLRLISHIHWVFTVWT